MKLTGFSLGLDSVSDCSFEIGLNFDLDGLRFFCNRQSIEKVAHCEVVVNKFRLVML